MATTTYFGNRARAAITAAGVAPVLADIFPVTRGFEASITWENRDLYGVDSTERVDEARDTNKNNAKLKGCKFDPTTGSATGVFKHILNALNGGSGGTGAYTDTNAVYLMDVYIWGPGSLTPLTNVFCVKIGNAYMEGPAFSFPENDYIVLDLSVWGRTGVINQTAIPTS